MRLYRISRRVASRTLEVVHNTSLENALAILREGFSLRKFGETSRKTGQDHWLSIDPRGIYFIRNRGDQDRTRPPHPWKPGVRGARVYALVTLDHPLEVGGFVLDEGKNMISYKKSLNRKYGGLHGDKLTRKLRSEGYDGIVTDGEIVVFDPRQIRVDAGKTLEELRRLNPHTKIQI